MGSFSEVVLGFSFRPDTPDYVLAAFSALAVPQPEGSRARTAPSLPPPHDPSRLDDDPFEPGYELGSEPWRQDWAGWFSQSMSVGTTPSAQMVWSETDKWSVTCRWAIKSHPEEILPVLRWLGPYLVAFDQRPILLGYIQYDTEPRPRLVWLTPTGQIQGEDLNTTWSSRRGARAGAVSELRSSMGGRASPSRQEPCRQGPAGRDEAPPDGTSRKCYCHDHLAARLSENVERQARRPVHAGLSDMMTDVHRNRCFLALSHPGHFLTIERDDDVPQRPAAVLLPPKTELAPQR